MLCIHLRPLESALVGAGFRETFRGQAWTRNCGEWVYFDVVLSDALEESLPGPVRRHENLDARSGTERGFVCDRCGDGILGRIDSAPVFPMPVD